MQFELLLAWASGLNLFPCSVLTFSDWLNKSCQKGNSFNCCYMCQRLEQCRQSWEIDLFYSFPPTLAWQLINHHIWWLYWKLDGPFKFRLSPSVCWLFWVWLAVPIKLKLETCVTGSFCGTELLGPSVKLSCGLLLQNATLLDLLKCY